MRKRQTDLANKGEDSDILNMTGDRETTPCKHSGNMPQGRQQGHQLYNHLGGQSLSLSWTIKETASKRWRLAQRIKKPKDEKVIAVRL